MTRIVSNREVALEIYELAREPGDQLIHVCFSIM